MPQSPSSPKPDGSKNVSSRSQPLQTGRKANAGGRKTNTGRQTTPTAKRAAKAELLTDGKAVTLEAIARHLGIARSTVSMGLRNNNEIAIATRQRIKAAAQELGYRPDPMLSALSARRGSRRCGANLALLVDDRWRAAPEGCDWLEEILHGMRTGAERYGYTLTEFFLDGHLRAWRNPDRVLTARGMTGLFLLPLSDPTIKLPKLDWKRYSVVAVGVPPATTRWHRTGMDSYGAMQLVCERLKSRGVRRVGLARQLDELKRMRSEWLGALSKEWFLPDPAMAIVPPYLPPKMEQESFTKWFLKEKPEVVVTHERKVIGWIRETGTRVPEEAGVVMLCNERYMPGQEAGIVQDIDQVGQAAVDLMHGLVLCGEKGEPVAASRELLVSARWTEGATLRKPIA